MAVVGRSFAITFFLFWWLALPLASQIDNIRLPKPKESFIPGEYDTTAVKAATERARKNAGLLEREIDPDTYIIGPGDGIALSIMTTRPLFQKTDVTPDGKLLLPSIGIVSVKGMTLRQMTAAVEEAARRIYKSADIAVSLHSLRNFKVTISGAVRQPATIEATPADRISEIIERAGGAEYNASLRSIQIRRSFSGDTTFRADLVRFYTLGDDKNNPTVMGGDRIIVPYLTDRYVVEASGAVMNADTVEFVEGDSLSTLLRMCGGFAPDAFLDSVVLARCNESNTKTQRHFYNLNEWRDKLFSAKELPDDFPLRPGDRIFVRSIPKWLETQQVIVAGEVTYPGVYPIRRNEDRLADIIERAGGFTDDASLEGALIVRREDIKEVDKEFERLSKIPPSEMNQNELWYYRARARENKGVMAVDFRRLFDSNNIEDNIILRNQDSIFVPASKNFINVLGRANSPGRVIYRPGLNFEQYIELAGGFGYRADESETVVVKPKGEQFLAKRKNYVLEPGDTIIIPEESDVSFLDVFKDALTILSQVATVALVVITAINIGR